MTIRLVQLDLLPHKKENARGSKKGKRPWAQKEKKRPVGAKRENARGVRRAAFSVNWGSWGLKYPRLGNLGCCKERVNSVNSLVS